MRFRDTSQAGKGTLLLQDPADLGDSPVCVCVCARARARMYTYVRACVHVYIYYTTYPLAHTHTQWANISFRLGHTRDHKRPSIGTRETCPLTHTHTQWANISFRLGRTSLGLPINNWCAEILRSQYSKVLILYTNIHGEQAWTLTCQNF